MSGLVTEIFPHAFFFLLFNHCIPSRHGGSIHLHPVLGRPRISNAPQLSNPLPSPVVSPALMIPRGQVTLPSTSDGLAVALGYTTQSYHGGGSSRVENVGGSRIARWQRLSLVVLFLTLAFGYRLLRSPEQVLGPWLRGPGSYCSHRRARSGRASRSQEPFHCPAAGGYLISVVQSGCRTRRLQRLAD